MIKPPTLAVLEEDRFDLELFLPTLAPKPAASLYFSVRHLYICTQCTEKGFKVTPRQLPRRIPRQTAEGVPSQEVPETTAHSTQYLTSHLPAANPINTIAARLLNSTAGGRSS